MPLLPSQYMGFIVPQPGVTPGYFVSPGTDYATYVGQALNTIDAHDHGPGSGAPLVPATTTTIGGIIVGAGLNITNLGVLSAPSAITAVTSANGLSLMSGTLALAAATSTTAGAVAASGTQTFGVTGSFPGLLAPFHDVASPGGLAIGGSTATVVYLAKAGVTTSALGPLSTGGAVSVNNGQGYFDGATLDSAAQLSLGRADAPNVLIATAGTTTTIRGPLIVGGTLTVGGAYALTSPYAKINWAWYDNTGTQTLTRNTYTALAYPHKEFDVYSTCTTSPWTFTAPSTGLYEVKFAASISCNSTTNTVIASVFVNGSETFRVYELTGPGVVVATLVAAGSAMVPMSAGQTMTIQIYFGDSTANGTTTAVTSANFVQVRYIPGLDS